ncbi:MAG: PAS domain-containing protein, partial [Steroidobacteraceae bacterium]
MNQLTLGVGAVAGLWCVALGFVLARLWRRRTHDWLERYDAAHQAVFEQWPTTALVLDPVKRRIVAANPAALRNTGYSLDEVREIPFTQ